MVQGLGFSNAQGEEIGRGRWRKEGELFLYQAESGGSGIVTRRLTGQAGSDEFVMKIPNNKV